ncbi:hypothetical protein HYV86_07605 [Candidatus Woesearchaeota archaeon]|nr:hypothetical protein [Candidatus Woesearchaeota archaeon]
MSLDIIQVKAQISTLPKNIQIALVSLAEAIISLRGTKCSFIDVENRYKNLWQECKRVGLANLIRLQQDIANAELYLQRGKSKIITEGFTLNDIEKLEQNFKAIIVTALSRR